MLSEGKQNTILQGEGFFTICSSLMQWQGVFAMGRVFMISGFIGKAMGRGFEKKL